VKTEKLRLLIVDDEEASRYGIRRALTTFGYSVTEADSAEAARILLKQQQHDLMLLDVNLPGISGLEFLREIKETNGNGPLVIIITAHGSERVAVEAVKSGAYDYLSKPFELDDLRLVIKNAAETLELRRENLSLRRRIEVERSQRGALIGSSEAMQRVRAMIEKVAETDATVLVRGESGTGKELVAREVHERNSERSQGPFVAVNCAALPSELIESELFGHEKGAFTGAAARRQGKFEQANGGTLFLDEIGDMSANVQAKLLRALEDRRIERLGGNESIPVDVRIVSATHRPLEQEIEAGNFRADLFYRLRVVTIDIPPLRERREDIPQLAETFTRAAAERYGLPLRQVSQSALRRLLDYPWPGNVRELKNTIERAAIIRKIYLKRSCRDHKRVSPLPLQMTVVWQFLLPLTFAKIDASLSVATSLVASNTPREMLPARPRFWVCTASRCSISCGSSVSVDVTFPWVVMRRIIPTSER
jgi:DNA-binding NtrC family response regulator